MGQFVDNPLLNVAYVHVADHLLAQLRRLYSVGENCQCGTVALARQVLGPDSVGSFLCIRVSLPSVELSSRCNLSIKVYYCLGVKGCRWRSRNESL